ncbi:MAG: hypothetical protein LBU14_03070 [Candidatus Peribacteria bacterium]|jgi:hypothetical protein|nr:hypothetical protein [Candidatus Peribacteria bacterium]
MKKNKAGDVFIIVLIIISLALIIGYIVINNISIMENNLLYTDNSNKLSKNLEEKANINFEAIFPNQNILSIVPEKAQSYNIFWNNYMTREIIEQNS